MRIAITTSSFLLLLGASSVAGSDTETTTCAQAVLSGLPEVSFSEDTCPGDSSTCMWLTDYSEYKCRCNKDNGKCPTDGTWKNYECAEGYIRYSTDNEAGIHGQFKRIGCALDVALMEAYGPVDGSSADYDPCEGDVNGEGDNYCDSLAKDVLGSVTPNDLICHYYGTDVGCVRNKSGSMTLDEFEELKTSITLHGCPGPFDSSYDVWPQEFECNYYSKFG